MHNEKKKLEMHIVFQLVIIIRINIVTKGWDTPFSKDRVRFEILKLINLLRYLSNTKQLFSYLYEDNLS